MEIALPLAEPLPNASEPHPIAVLHDAPVMPLDAPQPAKPFRIADYAVKFTPERARECAKKRWDDKKAAQTAIEEQNPTNAIQDASKAYLTEQRDILRARIKRLSDLMDTETDPSKLDRLASAWAKLSDQERITDGRPLPGSRKPANEPSTKRKPFNMQVD